MDQDQAQNPLALLMDIKLPVQVALGRARMPLAEVLRLTEGSVIELDAELSGAVEIIVHDKVIATGELVDVDGDYGIRILAGSPTGAGLNLTPAIEAPVGIE